MRKDVPGQPAGTGSISQFQVPISYKNLKKAKKLWIKIKDNNEEEGKVFKVRYRKYGINENVYRFDTRDYREIFIIGFKAWPKGSTPNSDNYILSKFINSRGQPLDYNRWHSK